MRHAPRLWPPPQRSTNSLTRTIDTPIIRSIFRTVLLFKGRRRRRAEDGAAVRDEGGDAPSVSSDETGKPGSLMRRPRFGLVSRPREALASRPPALGPAAPCQGLHVAATKERWPPLRIEVPLEGSVAVRKRGSRGQKTPQVERREAPRPDRKGRGDAFARCPGRPRQPPRERSQAPASAGAPPPSTRDAKNCNSARAYPAPTKEYGR